MSDNFNMQSTSGSDNPMLIRGNVAPDRVVTCTIHNYESIIRAAPQESGERWVYQKTYRPTPRVADESNPPKRQRTATVVFTKTYGCHRHTIEDNRTEARREDRTDDPDFIARPVQKKSKQVGCPAILKATCRVDDPNVVTITYKHEHVNHVPGSIADVQYLPYSDEVRDRIAEELEKGYGVRDVRTYLQREYVYKEETSHDSYITTALVYNIFYKHRQQKSERDYDDFASVKKWLMELQQQQHYHIWIESNTESTNSSQELLSVDGFAFGFIAPWQKQLLSVAHFISLDATHDVCDYDGGVLYTMVIRHPVVGRGVPIAYMFTDDQSSTPLIHWFQFLSALGVNPQRITIDRDLAEDNAISEVWPRCTIQYCIWHVSRAWENNITSKVVGMVGRTPAQARTVIRHHLYELMYEKDVTKFHELLDAFIANFETSQRMFISYFQRYWVDSRNGEGCDRWAACYQPEIYTNMETNNYVETWHNQLKTVYLKRKRMHRLDFMIDVLVNDVAFDIQQEVRRLSVNIGRMSKLEHGFRVEEQKLDHLSLHTKRSMVQMVTESIFMVNSLSVDDLTYEVHTENGLVTTCTCEKFTSTLLPCKHMFLVEQVIETVTVRQSMDNWEAMMMSYPPSNNQPQLHAMHASSSQDQLEKALKLLTAKANAVKRRVGKSAVNTSNPDCVQGIIDEIERVVTKLDDINTSLNDILSIPSNSNFRRQNDN